MGEGNLAWIFLFCTNSIPIPAQLQKCLRLANSFSPHNASGMQPFRSIALLVFLNLATVHAQPSGGPYGPLHVTYEVPKDAAHVYYVSPGGNSNASGATPDEPTTLESAIEKVVTGDAIIL